MTLPTFLKKLRSLRRKWTLEDGMIRCADGRCPIEAVGDVLFGTVRSAWFASFELGLRASVTDRIISAADGARGEPLLRKLRKQLLDATVNKRRRLKKVTR